MTWTIHTSFGLAILVALGGCGPGHDTTRPDYMPPQNDEDVPTGTVSESGGAIVTAMVGTAGGTLSLSNGAQLEIPSGALGDAVEITMATGAQSQAFNNRDYEKPIGPTIQIQPAVVAQPGQRFAISSPIPPLPSGFTEANITLAHEVVDPNQRELGGRGVNTRTVWQYADAAANGGRMTAQLSALGGFRFQFLVSSDEEFAREDDAAPP